MPRAATDASGEPESLRERSKRQRRDRILDAASELLRLQAQVGGPEVPAERGVGFDRAIAVQRDGELVERLC